MRNIYLLIFLLLFSACEDNELRPCGTKGEVVECVTNQNARLFYKTDLKAYVISYFVQGTIDSFNTGVVCTNDLNALSLDKSMNVEIVFSGCFLDDKDEIQPLSFMGGEEFFYLDITTIELVE